MVSILIDLLHGDPDLFSDPSTFNPDRSVGVKPDTYQCIVFGGNVRRCKPQRRVTRGIAARLAKDA
ncbi:hypothetical protein SAMN05216188_12956 [Lentzea xinjiangensis]|uniref:Cytochrome P450 n=1 Tax=Lentzea xinjiangensis TaxID=402600 RepID=A0A1H9W0V8_9PSEU|nr:hypothetical protein [Lentzea xinjiangensis]SES27297.1 hypothetical protein SAMN05216188_12956 [Lentzea xinjiangensis]